MVLYKIQFLILFLVVLFSFASFLFSAENKKDNEKLG